jgi:HlyD family type I secretion membrane fusion protein
MKLDFLSFGHDGGGGGGSGSPGGGRVRAIPRRLIERYMRQRLQVRPLDDASRAVRIGLIGAGLFFGLFFLFAMLAPISGAAVAEGEVSVSGDRLVIQPVSTGLVSEVLVREGQAVRAGQPLVRLNGVRSGAQLRQAQAQRDALRAAEARLVAQRDGAEELVFPADLTTRASDPSAAAAMRAQLALFDRYRAMLDADRRIADQQILAAEARRVAAVHQLSLINDELAGLRQLLAKGFARKTTVRALERSAAQLTADSLTGAAAVEEAEINRGKTRDGQVAQIVGELARVQEQLAQVNPQLDVTRYYADRDMLRAPVAGRIAALTPLGPGTVVSGGKTLMEVVPSGRALVVSVRVKPDDIDDVRIGAEATVRFSTVNPRGKSAFVGRVVTLSPARIEDGAGGHYRAQVALDDPAAAAQAGVTLQPGIPVAVTIETEKRTLWDYLTAPLTDAMSRSFREE